MNGKIHNRIVRTLLLAAAAFLAAACNETDTPGAPEESVMNFAGKVNHGGSEWDTKTKALDPAGIPSGARFGVFTYYTAGAVWSSAAGSTVPNIMYNQMVEKTETGTTYSPTRIWSIVPTDKYTFFAYIPYSDGTANNGTGVTMNTTVTTKSTPKVNFTVQDRVADHVDLLVAQVTNRTPDDYSPVLFTFTHATTRVRFAVAFSTGMEGYSATVTGIRLSGIRNTGILTLGGTTNQTPSWASLSGTASYAILDKDNPTDDLMVNYSAAPTVLATPNCYMIPQNGTALQPVVIEIDYAVTTHAGSEPYIKTTTLSLNGGTNWAIGKSILYTLTLQRTTISFTAKVADWETVTIDDNEIILEEEPMI